MGERLRSPWTLAVGAVVVSAAATVSVPQLSAVLTADAAPACTVAAAGDIAEAGGDQEKTAELVRQLEPTAVLTLGDNAYENGSASDFRSFYDPSWGQFKAITRPAVGNHEYQTEGAAGYLEYFGVEPYYAYDLCGWRAYSLNREISGAAREAELTWLKADLAAHQDRPKLAVWHEPRWTSGTKHGSDAGAADLWDAVVAGGVRVVLNGHEHSYERFAEMDAAGQPAPGGTREFIVGEGGGGDLSEFGSPLAASQVHLSGAHGVLAMTLRPDGYDWRLIQVGGAIGDQGTQSFGASAPAPSVPATASEPSPTSTSAGTVSYYWLRASQAAHVKGTEPTTRFGTAKDLVVDAPEPARYLSFVSFDLSVVPAGARAVSGRLYLRTTTDLVNPVDVYGAPSTWSQASLTWSSQPVFAPKLLGRLGAARAGTWVSIDVGPLLRSGGPVSFVLTGSAPGRSWGRFAADGTTTPPTLYLGLAGAKPLS